MSQYVALLRGINVGGKNIIKMADLRACFEREGFGDVETYIQSGNVLFTSRASPRAEIARRIEAMLATSFTYHGHVVLRTRKQLDGVVRGAPTHFGELPGEYRYDVIFLREPLTAASAMKHVSTKTGVDEVFAGKGALYFQRLIKKAAQSQLSKLISDPVYQSMTIRNWNTTTKLLEKMQQSTP